MTQQLHDELMAQIKVLSEEVWEHRCKQPDVEAWLQNFQGVSAPIAVERLHALHLLSHMSYFGLREIRMLLRSMYRDLYRYPRIQQIRSLLGGTRDASAVQRSFAQLLTQTKFLGMGNPAESGTHLLYYFRQENQLAKTCFSDSYQLFDGRVSNAASRIVDRNLRTLVFIDDVCGSGQQAVDYSEKLVADLRELAARDQVDLTFEYYVLFGTKTGMDHVRKNSSFDRVAAVHEIDDSHRAYSTSSRIFTKAPSPLSRMTSEAMSLHYGASLTPLDPLGYEDGQLLLGLHYNVPDNTLPVIWFDEDRSRWTPILPRYPKVYS